MHAHILIRMVLDHCRTRSGCNYDCSFFKSLIRDNETVLLKQNKINKINTYSMFSGKNVTQYKDIH